jgi:hypothetical protein
MLRLAIKLVITALVIHAAFRVGTTYWRFYQFQDALQELAQFGDQRPDKQLCAQAMDKAVNLEVPISAEALTIQRGANPAFNCEVGFKGAAPGPGGGTAKIFIEGHYREQLQILPGYRYPWDFNPSVSAWVRP